MIEYTLKYRPASVTRIDPLCTLRLGAKNFF